MLDELRLFDQAKLFSFRGHNQTMINQIKKRELKKPFIISWSLVGAHGFLILTQNVKSVVSTLISPANPKCYLGFQTFFSPLHSLFLRIKACCSAKHRPSIHNNC